jgi:hypothetical protein
MEGVQQFRCPCCGAWLWTFKQRWLNRGSRIMYCDGCKVESDPSHRTGPGRNQCQWYRDYPQTHDHWNDPKPELPAVGFAICIR